MRKTILLSLLVLFFITIKALITQLDKRALNYYSKEQVSKLQSITKQTTKRDGY